MGSTGAQAKLLGEVSTESRPRGTAILVALAASAVGVSCASRPAPRLHPPPPAQFCAAQAGRPNPMLLAVRASGATVQADASFAGGPLVLARYDGCNLEIFPRSACFGQGQYAFRRGTPRVQAEHRILHNRAEMTVEAPLLAAEIGGGMRTSEGVGLVLAESGFWEGDQSVVTRSNLQGDPGCVASATHFVRIAAVGAYEAYRDNVEALEARAGLPFFGAGGAMSSGRSSFTRAGDINACFQGNLAYCGAPIRFVLAALADPGAGVQCPAGKVPDQRGGCVDYVNPWTTFILSIGVQGPSCGDLVGDCEYGVEVSVGQREVAVLRGPQDSRTMAPVQLGHPFAPAELAQGVKVDLWDRDPFDNDWLGTCTIRRTWDELVPYVNRARSHHVPPTERVSCGARELLIKIEPMSP